MAVIDDYVAARKAGDFKAADEIRAKMRLAGVVLEVRRDGSVRQRGLRQKEREALASVPQNAERPSGDTKVAAPPGIVDPGATERNGAD